MTPEKRRAGRRIRKARRIQRDRERAFLNLERAWKHIGFMAEKTAVQFDTFEDAYRLALGNWYQPANTHIPTYRSDHT